MCAQRTIPYLKTNIIPSLKQGKNVLVAAHGKQSSLDYYEPTKARHN